jgi:hypothetical protein
MPSVQLFVGSNNVTGEVEQEKLEKILSRHVDGYTIIRSSGVWKGTRENSVMVEISEDIDVIALIGEIKRGLEQEAVAYRKVTPLSFA